MTSLARDALREGAREIGRASKLIEAADARRDAAALLEFVLGRRPAPSEDLPARALGRYRALIGRRADGEPVAYITRRTSFLGLTLEAGPGAWVPRRSSELLARRAIGIARRKKETVHVDVATGIGPIALSVANAVPSARVFGVDLAPAAILLARRNARKLGARNVEFFVGNLFEPLPARKRGNVDLITANAPYLARSDVRWLQKRVRIREPVVAMTDSSTSGLDLMERITRESVGWLRPRGLLVVQVASPVSRQVAALMRQAGLRDVRIQAGPPIPKANRLVLGRR